MREVSLIKGAAPFWHWLRLDRNSNILKYLCHILFPGIYLQILEHVVLIGHVLNYYPMTIVSNGSNHEVIILDANTGETLVHKS